MKRSDGVAALSWANNTRTTGDTRIKSVEYHVLSVIAGGCRTRAEIAAAVGCGESTVPRCVRKLIKIGALKRIERPGRANDYEVQIRQIDTGISSDTGIATSRTAKNTRISKVRESSDTGAAADTGPPVDNTDAHIRNARARGLDNPLTTGIGSSSERVEQHNTQQRARPDHGGSLVKRVCDLVDSPWLDPNKSDLLTLRPAQLVRWAAQLDVETELIPLLKTKLACNGTEPIGSWNYFKYAVEGYIRDKQQAQQEANHVSTASTASASVRRERISPLTAARRERQAKWDAEREPVDLGRMESQRID